MVPQLVAWLVKPVGMEEPGNSSYFSDYVHLFHQLTIGTVMASMVLNW